MFMEFETSISFSLKKEKLKLACICLISKMGVMDERKVRLGINFIFLLNDFMSHMFGDELLV